MSIIMHKTCRITVLVKTMEKTNLFLFSNKKLDSILRKINGILFEEYAPLSIIIILLFILIMFLIIRSIGKERNNHSLKEDMIQCMDEGYSERSRIQEGHDVNTNEQKNLIEDKELIAVITAAIMAYEEQNISSDGLVIRSIRKANRRKPLNDYSTY